MFKQRQGELLRHDTDTRKHHSPISTFFGLLFLLLAVSVVSGGSAAAGSGQPSPRPDREPTSSILTATTDPSEGTFRSSTMPSTKPTQPRESQSTVSQLDPPQTNTSEPGGTATSPTATPPTVTSPTVTLANATPPSTAMPTPTVGAAPQPQVTAPPTPEQRGQAALARITYPWQERLADWRISFHAEKRGAYGLTFVTERHIKVYVRANQSDELLAHVIAHEIGHAVDVSLNTPDERISWQNGRRISYAPWWPTNTASDFSTGAGDFAESFAYWQLGSDSFRSKLAGPPVGSEISLMQQLALG